MNTVPVGQLAPLLAANAAGYYASEAAVDLLTAHATWLGRADFVEACINYDHDGTTPAAWLDWAAVPAFLDRTPCSSSEARILRLAAELAGIDTGVPLDDLLSSLDDTNAARVLDAIAHTLSHGGHRWPTRPRPVARPAPARSAVSPLVDAGRADLWFPTRIGVDHTGIAARLGLAGATLAVTGPTGAGKTNAADLVTAAGLLEPGAWVLRFAGPTLLAWPPHHHTTAGMDPAAGPGPDASPAAVLARALADALRDVQRRHTALADLAERGLNDDGDPFTRQVAAAISAPPVVVVIDDIDIYHLNHATHGGAIAQRVALLAEHGPAAGYTLVVTSQDTPGFAQLAEAHLELTHRGAGTLHHPHGGPLDLTVDHFTAPLHDIARRRTQAGAR